MTLESLKAQIADAHGDLSKDLKKRRATEPKPEVVEIIEKVTEESNLDRIKRQLRERAMEAARRRKDLGKNNCSLALSA